MRVMRVMRVVRGSHLIPALQPYAQDLLNEGPCMWRARRCESSLTRPVICIISIYVDLLYDLCHLSPPLKFVKTTWNVSKVSHTGLLAPWPSISTQRAETAAKDSSSKWVTTTARAVKNLRHLLNYVYSIFPKSGNGVKRTKLKVDFFYVFNTVHLCTVSTFLYDKNTWVIVGGASLWRERHTHTRQEWIIIWSGRNWILKHAD